MNEQAKILKFAGSELTDPLMNPDGTRDFFADYMDYMGGTEVPDHANRWCAIGMLGAWLGRSCYFTFGQTKIYPNQYIMLIGSAGCKKSTAIKGAKRVLKAAGYTSFSAEKISKEKFLEELASAQQPATSEFDNILDQQLFGSELDTSECRETLICADEFNDFFANNILEFLSTLGVLWDYSGIYENKVKHGASVQIPNPYVSILSGNTPETMNNTFPQDAIGQGFFSRTIAVHLKSTGRRITWPKEIDEEANQAMTARLQEIKNGCNGEIGFTPAARVYVDKIYTSWKGIPDSRFEAYGNRRLIHLLKISMINACTRLSAEIDVIDIKRANTVLDYTEHFMPEAFGDFGMAKSSGLTHKVIQELEASHALLSVHELWAKMQLHFDKLETFQTHIMGMVQADKLQMMGDKLLPKRRILETPVNEFLDYRYMSAEERGE